MCICEFWKTMYNNDPRGEKMICPYCGEKMKPNSDVNNDDMAITCAGCGYFRSRDSYLEED